MFTVQYVKSKKVQTKELSTLEELFSFLHSMVGEFGWTPYWKYKDLEELFFDVAMNPNDKRGYSYFEGPDYRTLFIMEDGRMFDPRPYGKEIEQAKPYHDAYKPKGEAHSNEGRAEFFPRRPGYRQTIVRISEEREQLAELGLAPTIAKKYWWWYSREWCGGSRSWKDQTRSRKQWAKKKQNPVKRGYAQKVYPEEAMPIEGEA